MYDWPEVKPATDALWDAIYRQLKANGIDAPEHLSRTGADEDHWLAPDLLLGQTCGYPFSTILKGKVQYVATPVYDVEGCQGGYYSSAIVTHLNSDIALEDMGGTKFAFNSTQSLSGYRTVRAMIGEPDTFFATLEDSGGHRNSARMVAAGHADVAALDAVCWHLLQKHEPETAAQLKIIGWSALYPALPLITATGTNSATADRLRTVLGNVFTSLDLLSARKPLAIIGCTTIKASEYSRLAKL